MPAELPEQLELGKEVTEEMDTLWQKSIQDIDKGELRSMLQPW